MIDPILIQDIIADCAQKHLVPYFNKLTDNQISEKTSATDIVTQADIETEENLIKEFKKAYPDIMCIGEESFDPSNADILKASKLLMIDPLDGTNAFRNGSHGFAVLVSYFENGLQLQAWLCAPLMNEKLYAEKGKGVLLNGVTVQPKVLSDFTPQNGAGHLAPNHRPEMQAMAVRLKDKGLTIDSHTHACMDFLRFAKGELDYIVYQNCYPWDISVGALVVHELGGHAGLLYDQNDLMLEPFADINQPTLYTRRKEDWSVIRSIILAP